MMHTIRYTFIALCALAFSACSKKQEEQAVPAVPQTPGTTAPGAPATATGGAPSAPTPDPAAAKTEYTPEELWKATAGLSRMDLMEKFAGGATVTGTVKDVKDDPVGEYVIVFDAGDGKTVEAMIANPAPARDRKLKAGDTVTVTQCQIAAPTDTMQPLRTCDLK
jgi:hypothetical protein